MQKKMKYVISNDHVTAKINLFGAELTSLQCRKREYIWNGDAQFWAKQAPVLFPIVGTLKNNWYVYDQKNYTLNRHGFARDCNFKMVNSSTNEVTFSLCSNPCTLKIFPFKFELQINYKLHFKSLLVSYTVSNHDTKTIPFSIGAHPAFTLQQNISAYALQFEHQEVLRSYKLHEGLLTSKFDTLALKNKIMTLDYNLFKDDALVFKRMISKKITLLEHQKPLLSISYKNFEHFGIWTVANAPFICLEPWLGYSDSENHDQNILHKEAIQILKENCTFDCSYTITII